MFLLGGTFALVIRLELFQPGLQFLLSPSFFNQMTTMHGLVMVFGRSCQPLWAWQTDDSNDDWRARYGIAAYE